jgi:hypothetical protein
MSTIPKSNLLCPECQQPLSKLPGLGSTVILFCARGPCPSQAANDGAQGPTEEAAYAKLTAYIKNDQRPRPSEEN